MRLIVNLFIVHCSGHIVIRYFQFVPRIVANAPEFEGLFVDCWTRRTFFQLSHGIIVVGKGIAVIDEEPLVVAECNRGSKASADDSNGKSGRVSLIHFVPCLPS